MKCKVPACTYNTDEDIESGCTVMGKHVSAMHPVHQSHPATNQQAAVEKYPRPKLALENNTVDKEAWDISYSDGRNLRN